jgi:hypothetical protein
LEQKTATRFEDSACEGHLVRPMNEIPENKHKSNIRNIVLTFALVLSLSALDLFINTGLFFYFSRDAIRNMPDYSSVPGEVMGLTLDEVEKKYGKPSEFGASVFPGWDRVYNLGPDDHLFSVDSKWLLVRVNSESRVIEARTDCD